MAMNRPGEPGDPLQGLLGDLLKVLGGAGQGSVPWLDSARTLALGVATDGQAQANVDPLERIRLEQLARVAALHVADSTGAPLDSGRGPVELEPVTRAEWASRCLEAWRPVVEVMVAHQSAPPAGLVPGMLGDVDTESTAGLQELLGRFAATMGPMLLGLQFGSAAGHLAQRALGQYALPLPWPESDRVVVVPENIAAFARDWSLQLDQAELWVCVRELVAHSVLRRPAIAAHVRGLLEESALASVALQADVAERLSGSDDPEALQRLMADPESLLADLLTPGQRHTSARLGAFTTAFGGYVDHLTETTADVLLGTSASVREAWYRHRIADSTGEQAAGALLGLELGRAQVDAGAAFVAGVLERAGEAGLARLWDATSNVPTPAEISAPGLWLERIDLPDGPSGPA
jgi:putative hydrolase